MSIDQAPLQVRGQVHRIIGEPSWEPTAVIEEVRQPLVDEPPPLDWTLEDWPTDLL
ncbi:MAG TPA: hypothetical protein VGF84_00765 [Micromonosporaceae bacterium]